MCRVSQMRLGRKWCWEGTVCSSKETLSVLSAAWRGRWSAAVPKLRALALQQSQQHMDVPVYAQFVAYYGNAPDWLDQFTRAVLSGTGAFSSYSDGARAELVEKTLINTLLPLASLTALHEARVLARDGFRADGQVSHPPAARALPERSGR